MAAAAASSGMAASAGVAAQWRNGSIGKAWRGSSNGAENVSMKTVLSVAFLCIARQINNIAYLFLLLAHAAPHQHNNAHRNAP